MPRCLTQRGFVYMKKIIFRRKNHTISGKVLVDDDVYEWAKNFTWYKNAGGYAENFSAENKIHGGKIHLQLHRIINV